MNLIIFVKNFKNQKHIIKEQVFDVFFGNILTNCCKIN